MNIYEGKLKAEGLKIGIILSRFNQFIINWGRLKRIYRSIKSRDLLRCLV